MTDTTQPGADNALDLDAIEAAARAATPGPWEYQPMGETTDPEIFAWNGSRVCTLVAADMTKQNSRFIAAANPETVLALIALARRAAQPVEPIYQRDDNGAWRDTSLIGMQSWKDAGYETRVVYATHPAEPVVGAPADCSGTPDSCPDNEGYGCHCSPAEPAVGGALVAMPRHLLEEATGGSEFLRDCALSAIRSIICDGPAGALAANAEPELNDQDRDKLVSAIQSLSALASGTVNALGSTNLLKQSKLKTATMADVKRSLPYIVGNLQGIVLKLDGGVQGGVTQANSAESIPTKGNGDTDKGEGNA